MYKRFKDICAKSLLTILIQCSISIPPENVREPKVFLRFQGVKKRNILIERVNDFGNALQSVYWHANVPTDPVFDSRSYKKFSMKTFFPNILLVLMNTLTLNLTLELEHWAKLVKFVLVLQLTTKKLLVLCSDLQTIYWKNYQFFLKHQVISKSVCDLSNLLQKMWCGHLVFPEYSTNISNIITFRE